MEIYPLQATIINPMWRTQCFCRRRKTFLLEKDLATGRPWKEMRTTTAQVTSLIRYFNTAKNTVFMKENTRAATMTIRMLEMIIINCLLQGPLYMPGTP